SYELSPKSLVAMAKTSRTQDAALGLLRPGDYFFDFRFVEMMAPDAVLIPISQTTEAGRNDNDPLTLRWKPFANAYRRVIIGLGQRLHLSGAHRVGDRPAAVG